MPSISSTMSGYKRKQKSLIWGLIKQLLLLIWCGRCLKFAGLLNWHKKLYYPSQTGFYLFHSEVKAPGDRDIQPETSLIFVSLLRRAAIHSTNIIDYLLYKRALMILHSCHFMEKTLQWENLFFSRSEKKARSWSLFIYIFFIYNPYIYKPSLLFLLSRFYQGERGRQNILLSCIATQCCIHSAVQKVKCEQRNGL